MEETGVFGEKHRPAASHWQTLSHNVVSSTPQKQQHMFTFVASTWLEWSIILNWGLGGRILDLDPIGFCPLLGKYGPGVGTKTKYTSYIHWFMSVWKPLSIINQLYLGIQYLHVETWGHFITALSTPCHGEESNSQH